MASDGGSSPNKRIDLKSILATGRGARTGAAVVAVRTPERSNTWELTMFRAERVGG